MSQLVDLSVTPLIIESPYFVLKVYAESDFAEYIVKNDTLLNEEIARASKRKLQEAGPGKKYFLLVSSEGFFRVTKKARRLGADKSFSTHLAAVACYTNNPSLTLLGELYNKINKPAVPTKIFSSRESAQEWLNELMKQPKAVSQLTSK